MLRPIRPDLSPPQQLMFLKANPICVGHGTLNAAGLSWEYRVRPTPLSREYLVRIVFNRGDTPKVFVVEPNLQRLAGGRKLPHVYYDPVRLCLYLPKAREWVGSMRIDQSFVPWAATWLYYFEEWLASDDWKGGGEHPRADDDETYNRRARRAARRWF